MQVVACERITLDQQFCNSQRKLIGGFPMGRFSYILITVLCVTLFNDLPIPIVYFDSGKGRETLVQVQAQPPCD